MAQITRKTTWVLGFAALAIPVALALFSAAKADDRPARTGSNACTRCYCDRYQAGGGNACTRSSCRHQWSEHKS